MYFVFRKIPFPAAQVGDLLGLSQLALAFAKLFLGLSSFQIFTG